MKFSGWSLYGIAAIAGALAALAMPPLFWLPLGFLGVGLFVGQWDSAPTTKAAFLRGWVWGWGHFVVGSYWMVEAFFVPPADFAWLGVPAVLCVAVVFGFFPAMTAGVARWLVLRWPYLGGRYRRVVLLAVLWTATEWLRGHIFTGDPWNPLGHVWAFSAPLLQGAALFSVYGLGTFTFMILASVVAGVRALVASAALVAAAFAAGFWMMPPVGAGPDGPVVRIVQPNVPQGSKWSREDRSRQFQQLIDISRRPGLDRVAAVVWPETAVPFLLPPDSGAFQAMAAAVPPGGYLLAGAARTTPDVSQVWNSLLVLDGSGVVRAHYDKVHLVPFGEYIPYHKEWPPIGGLVGRNSFETGEGFTTLSLPGLPPFSPTICYEAIFPGAVTGPGERPRWMVNVTNDAWFGTSSGPYQHLTSARLRAVEEGLPMIRAANTGVSAVIDSWGRLVASLDMEKEGIIDHAVPPSRAPTPYSRWGDLTLLALLVFLGLFTGLKRSR